MTPSVHRRGPARVVAFGFALVAFGCAHTRSGPPNLPLPSQSTTLGPGDFFEVSVLGENEGRPVGYRVQPDGTIVVGHIGRIAVGGLEPQQIEELIKTRLAAMDVYPDTQVTLVVKQYNSKRISIIGAVQKPGSFSWTEGMRLIDAISLAGGLTSIANGDQVRITRVVGASKMITATVSIDDISEGRISDVPLQAGDTIKVDQRIF